MTHLASPCWYVEDRGAGFAEAPEIHHGSHAAAVEEAAGVLESIHPDLEDLLARAELVTIRRSTIPCLVVSCSRCQVELEDGDWGSVIHFEGPHLADDIAQLNGWQVLAPGGWLCEECTFDPDLTEEPVAAAAQPGPGQLSFDGSEVPQ